MTINNLQSHHRDLGHNLGPPNGSSPPYLCCMRSPGAPSHSAALRAWPPETHEQSHKMGKVLKFRTIKCIPSVYFIIITPHYHWEKTKKRKERKSWILCTTRLLTTICFLPFPLSLSPTALYDTFFIKWDSNLSSLIGHSSAFSSYWSPYFRNHSFLIYVFSFP